MQYTELGLPILPQSEKGDTSVKDFVDAIAGETETSAFHILDRLITQMMNAQGEAPVFSEDMPDEQADGDIWNQILSIE